MIMPKFAMILRSAMLILTSANTTDSSPVDIANLTDSEVVVERQLRAYNSQNLDEFVSYYHPDVLVFKYPGNLLIDGISDFRLRYAGLFRRKPKNVAVSIERLTLGERIIEYETVYGDGLRGDDITCVVAIYDFKDGLISRVEFVFPVE